MISFFDRLQSLKQRHPRLWLLARHPGIFVERMFYRVALLPFWRRQKPGSTAENPHLVQRAEEYNAAAERYFADFPDRQFLLDKPFSDAEGFPDHLIRAGTLMAAGRIRPGDTVVEIGAGTCWLSHFLNRYGCRTVAVDVSRTALDLGRQLFEREPSTDWSLEPRFVEYDGCTLPLEDAVCDCVVVYDAFHHIPNQRVLLAEMRRILRPRGMVVMSEPGIGHADEPASIAERETGVLENELVVADMAALAAAVGFHDTTLVVATPYYQHEIPANKLGAFAGGSGFRHYWTHFSQHLMAHHYILIYKGANTPTTDRPGNAKLRATIGIDDPADSHGRWTAGNPGRATVSVENRGEAVWLHAEGRGWTRLGGHLYVVKNGARELVDNDWLRAGLERDLKPEDRVVVKIDTPAIDCPGTYEVEFDIVLENVTWFARRGSPTATLNITVE